MDGVSWSARCIDDVYGGPLTKPAQLENSKPMDAGSNPAHLRNKSSY
jgi:hypothetical protein